KVLDARLVVERLALGVGAPVGELEVVRWRAPVASVRADTGRGLVAARAAVVGRGRVASVALVGRGDAEARQEIAVRAAEARAVAVGRALVGATIEQERAGREGEGRERNDERARVHDQNWPK